MPKIKRATLSKPVPLPTTEAENVLPIDYTELTLWVKHYQYREGKLTPIYVYRMLFDSVPPVKSVENHSLHNERLSLVKKVYEWVKDISNNNGTTAKNYFDTMLLFIRFCDANKIIVEITEQTINAYTFHIREKLRLNPSSAEACRAAADSLSYFLAWSGYDDLAKLLPKVVRSDTSLTKTQAYSDDELRSIASDLFCVFNVLVSRLKTGEPTNCPFNKSKRHWDSSASNTTAWYNKLTATAFFITSKFIGDNNSPLLNIRISDVIEKDFKFDKTINCYILTTKKGRQGGQSNEWALGFTARGRDFFIEYLNCLKIFNLPDDAYLFPCFTNGKYRGSLSQPDLSTYASWFSKHSIHGIRPIVGRFRQTKSDGIMTRTNSIDHVAKGLNNSKITVFKNYMKGSTQNNRNCLGSAAEAIELIARGNSIDYARKIVGDKYKKPRRIVEIIATEQLEPTQTSVGTRCKQPFGEKSKRLMRELKSKNILHENESIACFKFLDCFWCENQVLVAESDDIWCLLSFRAALREALLRPNINHQLPVEKVMQVIAKCNLILLDIKQDYSDVYAEAEIKYHNISHPLWGDEESAADLYQIWGGV